MESVYWFYGFISGIIANFLAITSMMVAMNYYFTSGKKLAFSLGLGNSFMQIMWSAIASVFMISFKAFPPLLDKIFTAIGIGILLYIAIKILTFKIPEKAKETKIGPKKYVKAFSVGFFLSFFTPQRILFYVGIFAAFNIHHTNNQINNLPIVFGVWVGAILFWVLFIFGMSHLKRKISMKKMKFLQKIGAILLIIIAIYSDVSLMR